MSDTKVETRWMLEHSGSWGAALVLGAAVASATSCLGANAGHCLYGGGDLACGSEICVFAPRGEEAPGVGDDGCFDGTDAPSGFFYARYGLPARLEAAEGDTMDLAAVEGLLRRLVDGERSVDASDLARFEGVLVDDVVRIRSTLTREGGVIKAGRDLEGGDEDAITAYYTEIDAWLAEQPPDTETGSDTETTGATLDDTMTSTGDTSEPECMGAADCMDDARPFCNEVQECVTCEEIPDSDGACASVDAGAPLCVGGQCVQCTAKDASACMGTTPVCDAGSNTCVACSAHDQCGETACNLYTGACLPGDAVVEVGGPKPDYPTLAMAVASFAEGAEGTIVVHEGMPSYDQSVIVDGGRVLAFLAAEVGPGVDPPRWIRSSGASPQLTVGADSTVLMDGLQLSGNASSAVPGLRVDGGRAWVDRSRVVTNLGGGIVAQAGAELTLRNCFVGGSVNNVPALEVDGATAMVAYTTVIGGLGMTAVALTCTPPSTLSVTDSIVLLESGNAPVSCGPAVFDHSASEMSLPGDDNVDVGDFDDGSTWFEGVATGDFHLTPAGVITFADIAQWQAGDPSTDIDVDPRPQVDGTEDHAGADVP
jgi:hypothetical protein